MNILKYRRMCFELKRNLLSQHYRFKKVTYKKINRDLIKFYVVGSDNSVRELNDFLDGR